MLTAKQIKKMILSLRNNTDHADLLLIPYRIAERCIANAKTSEAKHRLVHLTNLAAIEEMKRLYVRGYDKLEKKKSIFTLIKEAFNV